MASVGAASETLDEIMATLNLNKTANSLKVYKELLEELTVSHVFRMNYIVVRVYVLLSTKILSI